MLITSLGFGELRAADATRVAVASSLRQLWPALLEAYEAPATVQASFGSSGNLARQIEQGAPFDLFLSASRSYAERLVMAGLTRGAGERYATGRLSLLGRGTVCRLNDAAPLPALAALLVSGEASRLAIANPSHAPYGLAAREALQSTGVWRRVESRLSLAENAAQAVQFLRAGAADSALVPSALVPTALVSGAGQLCRFRLAASLHAPLRHYMVRIDSDGERPSNAAPSAADRFFEFLRSTPARAVFASHGFDPP